MAIQFEFYESPDPTGEGNEKYHARTVNIKTVDTPEIMQHIQEVSTLSAGDIKAVLVALSDAIASNLRDSKRVHLEGIGYFQSTLKTSREVVPGKTRAQSVWFKAVSFRADKLLKSRLVGAVTERSAVKSHSVLLTNNEVDRRVRNFFIENEILNTQRLRSLCGFTKYAATKHIKRLVEEGKIKNIYTKKNPVYVKGEL